MNDKHNTDEIESLAAAHGVGNINDFRSSVHFDEIHDEPKSADEKAIICLSKELARTPSFSSFSEERLFDIAERLYAASYQKALSGQASSDELSQLAARRGQSESELRIDLFG